MFKRGPRPLTVAQQYVRVQFSPLCPGVGALRRGRFYWRYKVSPTPVSRVYSISLRYRVGGSPSVIAEEPALKTLAGGRRIPHVYDQDPARLCLYLPGKGEWRTWMPLDETVVPWVALWLFYFEEWLVSDEWKGGGAHPPKS